MCLLEEMREREREGGVPDSFQNTCTATKTFINDNCFPKMFCKKTYLKITSPSFVSGGFHENCSSVMLMLLMCVSMAWNRTGRPLRFIDTCGIISSGRDALVEWLERIGFDAACRRFE